VRGAVWLGKMPVSGHSTRNAHLVPLDGSPPLCEPRMISFGYFPFSAAWEKYDPRHHKKCFWCLREEGALPR